LHGVDPRKIGKFLFEGLGLRPELPNGELVLTDRDNWSTEAEALLNYASVKVPRPDDHPIVYAVLKIRSLAKGIGTFLDSLVETPRSAGASHPKFTFALTPARMSAQDPPVHQLPEKADKEVAKAIKACMVPRINPVKDPKDWDPRV